MVSENTPWIIYPSQDLDPQINIEDIIASQNIISRVMHFYIAFLVPVGLFAGICILTTFSRLYYKHKALEKLEICLFDLAITDITILLFSFTAITRPGYMEITNLSCGVLAFFFNISYFNSQYLQVLLVLIFFLNQDLPRTPLIIKLTQNTPLCASLTLASAFCSSLILVAILGTVAHLHEPTHCQVDPLNASHEYDIVKFSFGFAMPSFFNTLFLVLIFVKLAKNKEFTFKEISYTGSMVLPISIIMFSCRLFYNIMLLSRAMLKLQRQNGSPRDELVMNIAELVMFSQSCFSLIIILFLNKPCKEWVHQMFVHLTKRCKRNGTANVNSTNDVPETEEAEHVTMSACSENGAVTALDLQQKD